MLIDLHVHSSYSRGCELDPAQVVSRAEALGLDGVCFTDLNTIEGAGALHALRERTKIAVLVGVEVATDHGHYLCFFPKPEEVPEPAQMFGAPPAGKPWPARHVVDTVRQRGGVVVAAHPYDRDVEKPSGDFIFTLKGLDAIEGYAGTRRTNVNELAIEAADHLSLPCVGGSAASKSYEEIGTAATLFREEVRDEAALVDALRAGAVWAVAIGTPPKFLGDEQALRERESFRGERRGGPREERRGGRDERRGGGRGGGGGGGRDERRGGRRRGGRGRGGGGRH